VENSAVRRCRVPSGTLLTGKRFGYLTVGRELRCDVYECTCKCGSKIEVFRSQLTRGAIRHCGCRNKNNWREGNSLTFGHFRAYVCRNGKIKTKTSSEWNSWSAMRNRCKYKALHEYAAYGGRGIRVCARWLEPRGHGFLNFINDMGPRPCGKTLDRKEVNGHYEPGNCRWADSDVQHNNQRRFLWPDGVGEPAVVPMNDLEDELLACG
jgi:hypothetical protein